MGLCSPRIKTAPSTSTPSTASMEAPAATTPLKPLVLPDHMLSTYFATTLLMDVVHAQMIKRVISAKMVSSTMFITPRFN